MKTEIMYTPTTNVILTIGPDLTVTDAQMDTIKTNITTMTDAPTVWHNTTDGVNQLVITPTSRDTSRSDIHAMIEKVLGVTISRAP